MTPAAIRIEVAHIVRTERSDSLEVGSMKTGIIKVYGDASKPEEFEQRVKNMITLRERAAHAMQAGPGYPPSPAGGTQ